MTTGPVEVETLILAEPTLLEFKDDGSFRNYQDSSNHTRVERNYFLNHKNQTLDFVLECKKKYSKLAIHKMSIWQAIDLLNDLTDDSDPDTDVPQIIHALQTAEACRAAFPDEKYDWIHLIGLIHDLGKVLAHPKFGENPQWAVVGDTFPVGCQFSDKIVFSKFFSENPDSKNPTYQTKLGIYETNCGIENLQMSWGHDEYMYMICVGNGCTLPPEALYTIRFHSFYPLHQAGSYSYFCTDFDREMIPWLQKFSKCDLYTKHENPPNVEELLPYYKQLVKKYFPNGDVLNW